eukprot:2050022-Alexandrium_andersonii.AAC.1
MPESRQVVQPRPRDLELLSVLGSNDGDVGIRNLRHNSPHTWRVVLEQLRMFGAVCSRNFGDMQHG